MQIPCAVKHSVYYIIGFRKPCVLGVQIRCRAVSEFLFSRRFAAHCKLKCNRPLPMWFSMLVVFVSSLPQIRQVTNRRRVSDAGVTKIMLLIWALRSERDKPWISFNAVQVCLPAGGQCRRNASPKISKCANNTFYNLFHIFIKHVRRSRVISSIGFLKIHFQFRHLIWGLVNFLYVHLERLSRLWPLVTDVAGKAGRLDMMTLTMIHNVRPMPRLLAADQARVQPGMDPVCGAHAYHAVDLFVQIWK